jgi:ribonuclease HI
MEELWESEGKPHMKPRVAAEQRVPSWIPPPQGTTKINVDMAMGKNTGQGSIAAVARDDTGLYLGVSVVVFPAKTNAETLEALACKEAVSLTKDINARRVRVASDSKNVVANLEKGTMGVYTHIVWEIRN